jgi:hypothetical protein
LIKISILDKNIPAIDKNFYKNFIKYVAPYYPHFLTVFYEIYI